MHLDRVDDLRELVRGVSKLLNQPVYQLGSREVAQMAALIERNRKFDMSMSRAAYGHMVIEKTEISRRAIGYDERVQIIRDSNFTVEQLKAILSDESKMAELSAAGTGSARQRLERDRDAEDG